MYTIVTDFDRPDPALVARAKDLYVCMAGIELGPRQCVDSAIKPLRQGWKIAGPAFTDSDDGEVTKGGTGYGVRLLVELIRTFEKPVS